VADSNDGVRWCAINNSILCRDCQFVRDLCNATATSSSALGPDHKAIRACPSPLGVLAAKSAHGVTSVATFILLANIGNQRFRTLHFDFEGGDQRVFRVNDNMSRFPLNFKTDRKLHLLLSHSQQM
jgi:hypothetical protein